MWLERNWSRDERSWSAAERIVSLILFAAGMETRVERLPWIVLCQTKEVISDFRSAQDHAGHPFWHPVPNLNVRSKAVRLPCVL